MFYPEERMNYINFIRAFQGRMDVTNKKMAELLGLPERTFYRFMSGVTILNELDLTIRIHEMSGKMMYQMVGAKVPAEVEHSQIYAQLNPEFQQMADENMKTLWAAQKRLEKSGVQFGHRNQQKMED